MMHFLILKWEWRLEAKDVSSVIVVNIYLYTPRRITVRHLRPSLVVCGQDKVLAWKEIQEFQTPDMGENEICLKPLKLGSEVAIIVDAAVADLI